jgi:CheY-like chemotaxis protein
VITRLRLLVVEDEEINLADLVRTLRKLGYRIAATASSRPKAIRAAASANPDLVLMDVRLKGDMDGIEAARQIREASEVPILFVTAHTGGVTPKIAELPGHFGTISKPFSPSKLRDAIDATLPDDLNMAGQTSRKTS